MTIKDVFGALKKELGKSGIMTLENNFVFESVNDVDDLEKYLRYLIVADEDTNYMERNAPRASCLCGGVWTLTDGCGNFVAVAHVDTNDSHEFWKGEVMYLHN